MENLIVPAFLAASIAFGAALFGVVSPEKVTPKALGEATRIKAFSLYMCLMIGLITFMVVAVPVDPESQQPAGGTGSGDNQLTAAAEDESASAPADESEAEQDRQEQSSGDDEESLSVNEKLDRGWAELDKSEEMQSTRERMINELKDAGVVYKIERPGRYPRVYVERRWHDLKFDERETFANLILAYFFAQDREADMLIIRDAHSGDDLNSFTFQYGFLEG